ncbi:hypothetical protein Q4519_21085 [Motilimonas sp. 1_MG-2023]|uniref:hypothetical protein n=1 Tax=Motilimonas sp. 1_MG-2023 TaxID=3062672 RepID=UPI0026E33B2A|nr:hypothetical protein [Motilimonas sp. 1_MG-2023]MDO6528169.1 hypothetical protein [Motilimonas sp. 1_MG-2023]
MIWLYIIIAIIVTILFIRFPKPVGAFIGIIGIALGAVYFYYDGQQKQIGMSEGVEIAITFDTKNCTKELPLLVTIQNNSQLMIERINWNIGAHTKTDGNNIIYSGNNVAVDYGFSDHYSSEKILDLGQKFSSCYQIPSLTGQFTPEDLNWSIVQEDIIFQN